MNNEKRIKEIEKEFTNLGLINAVPMILICFGFYAKFGQEDELIFEFLKNDVIVSGMFIVSVPVVLWCMFRVFKLASEKSNLEE